MKLLNLINILSWLVLLFHCGKSYWCLRGGEFTKQEIMVIAITLLTGLNIFMWSFSTILVKPQYAGLQLLDYFKVGISIFQLLICHFILSNIKCDIQQNKD